MAQQPAPLKLQTDKLLYADSVYQEAITEKDSLKLAEAYFLYGKTYNSAGDYLMSQQWFLHSLAILEPRGDSYALSRLYSVLSYLQENYQETLHYAFLSLAVSRRIKSDKALMRAYLTLAHIYQTDWSGKNQHVYGILSSNVYRMDWSKAGKKPNLPKPRADSALYYIKKVYELSYKLNDHVAMIESNIHLGRFLWNTYQNPRALDYLQKGLAIATADTEERMQIRLMLYMTSVHIARRQPTQAARLLTEAQQLLDRSDINDYFINAQFEGAYTDYYSLIGDWKRAFEHGQKLHTMEINNYIADHDGAVTRLSMEYKSEQKEAKLRAQKNELELRSETLRAQQRLTWAISALLGVTVAMAIVFFRLYRKNRRMSERNVELVREQNHRVKNNLQVISSLLNLQFNQLTDENAKRMVEESQMRVQAMSILHQRLYAGDEQGDQQVVVDTSEFIIELVEEVLKAYGYSAIHPIYDLDPLELSADEALPLGLIINELTTNACKYAFADHPYPAFSISSRRNGNKFTLSVTDNGPGLPSHVSMDGSSNQRLTFGLRLILMEVQQLQGTCEFESKGGTHFSMEFKV
ncbi:sensor histidine kinase [Larkinella insperata]|uniref:histidine kinase n=1 Tax=Larkinella insperata TaxID=332158 RepID=A0ABW3Q9J5_9BACT|nr:sensor histidine kinase [Larkinella insperata]